jgi:hypothetical protein
VSIHVALNHVTHYRYDRPISLSPQVVRLRPAPHSRTPILSYSLKVTPAGTSSTGSRIPQSNYLARLVFPEKTREFCVEVDLVAEMSVINPFDFFLEPHAEKIPFAYEDWQREELAPYLQNAADAAAAPLPGDRFPRAPRPASTSWSRSTSACSRTVRYLIRLEPGVQTPEETLKGPRLVPRLGLAAGAGAAPPRAGGALRVRLPDPARARREVARRPFRHRPRLHRPARLVRGLPAGRRLGRPRPDLRPVRRRGPHSARLLARAVVGGADHRLHREMRGASSSTT